MNNLNVSFDNTVNKYAVDKVRPEEETILKNLEKEREEVKEVCEETKQIFSNVIREDRFEEIFCDEIKMRIFIFLPYEQLKKCRWVCKHWWSFTTDPYFLKKYIEAKKEFGKEKWEKYFKVVIENNVPLIPSTLIVAMEEGCPFNQGKKVNETHNLVYKPKQINGESITTKTFKQLITNRNGKKGFNFLSSTSKKNINNKPDDKKGEWLLITKKPIPGSFNKIYKEQQELLEKFNTPKAKYVIPSAVEQIVSFITQEKDTGMVPFEKISVSTEDALISFSSDGLNVAIDEFSPSDDIGICAVRKS